MWTIPRIVSTSSAWGRVVRRVWPIRIRWPIGWDAVWKSRMKGNTTRASGGIPRLSFKDRGMAMTVSMARALGLTRLAVPTQGNAGDSLAEYAVAAEIEAVIVMSPDTDLPVLGKVAALALLHPERVKLELVAGTIIDCGKRVRDGVLPQGYFSVATFQEPGWRTEGKKTLGLEMAEPAGDRLDERRWQLPDVIVYPTGGGTGVVGMAKAFDELEALGLVGPDRPRMVCVQSAASTPIVRAFEARRRRHRAPTPGPDDRHGPERGAERRSHQCPADHPRVRRLCRYGLRRGHRRRDPRRMARATLRLVAGGGRDARRTPGAGRPRHDPSRRPGRPGQHGLRREIPAHDPRVARWGALNATGVIRPDCAKGRGR